MRPVLDPVLMKAKRWRRVLARVSKWIGAVFLCALGYAVIDGWTAFGHRATGERRMRMERSPQWSDGQFVNPQPIVNNYSMMMKGLFGASDHGHPEAPLPTVKFDPKQAPPATGLRVTWFGHSTTLIEIDGHRVLTDPMWSGRAGPIHGVGPTRWNPPIVAIEDLPKLDAVLISHDHYDHLDLRTVRALNDLVASKGWDTKFVVPLGLGAHLSHWGVPESRIAELDWWERKDLGGVEVVCTPARHATGRTLFDRDATLWAGYAVVGSKHRAYFSGDTGLFPGMKEIGDKLGPFDVTLIEIGQYHGAWPDWHIGPEQAIAAHQMLRGKIFFPIHWGLLKLAYHGWTEPIERATVAAEKANVSMVSPKPGEGILPDAPPAPDRWWPTLPWESAEKSPIVSGNLK